MIRVLGIGSPWGDDAVGWEVAQAIAAESLDGVEVRILDRPGIGLVDHLTGVEAAILIDAVLAEGDIVPGMIVEADLRSPTLRLAGVMSTHGLGVFEAIELARALGTVPTRFRLIAIAIDPTLAAAPNSTRVPNAAGLSSCSLRPAIRDAVEPACERARRWVEAWQETHLPND